MGIFDFLSRKKKVYEHVLEVGDDNFELQVIQRSYKTPIMVDYWAAWCVPCRQFGPVLERVAMEPDSGFLLAKLNTEHNRRTAARYNIRTIPAIKIFRNGRVVHEFTGMRLEHQVREIMAQVIELDSPTPHLKISTDPAKRLKQGQAYLRKGKGFHAAVCLDNFPDSPQAEEAAKLLPLAHFLWGLDDGDALTGSRKVDELYCDAADAFDDRHFEEAQTLMQTALQSTKGVEQAHAQEVLDAMLYYSEK